MSLPTNGLEVVFDGDNPRTFTGIARETISGGQLVVVSGAGNNVIGSSISQYATSDIQVAKIVSPEAVNGIALNTVTSGQVITVATRGAYILGAAGSVLAGRLVEAVDSDNIQTLSSGAVPSALHAKVPGAKIIGRAITEAGSEGFALIDLHP